MTFIHPLGLLGLIGVPILIIIYLIKNKYTEQTIASTYLWTLSEKFLKRKKTPPKLVGLISLILQIIIVIAISLTIANPVFIFSDKAHEYCFILDASGSMQMEQDGNTRFEIAKEEIRERIDDSMKGSVYTIVCVSATETKVICNQSQDKEEALSALSKAEPSYGTVSFVNALEIAQGYFNESKGMETYLVTDKSYKSHDNVELINVSDGEQNYAVVGVTCERDSALAAFKIEATIVSFEEDGAVDVRLYMDDTNVAVEVKTENLVKGEEKTVQFYVERNSYAWLKVEIPNADSLMTDNEKMQYNLEVENSYDTLLVSENPKFLSWALESVGNANIKTYSPKEYAEVEKTGAPTGYGLYIYDNYVPNEVPVDGAVWYFNLNKSLEGTGFTYQAETAEKEVALRLKKTSSSTSRKLTADLQGAQIYVAKYIKYGLYYPFTVLYETPTGDPVVFTGTNVYGNSEVVFGFSFENSNFSIVPDYVILMRNLVEFSFPDVLERAEYDCGEKLAVNVPPACTTIKIKAPNGEMTYPATGIEAAEYVLTIPGTYQLLLTVSGEERSYNVYAGIPKTESCVTATEDSFRLQGEASDERLDGKYDDLIFFFILLFVVFAIDWGVYCYDKYQLR
ncbi:MAG: BatA and WFA domain-containing protein [Clostridia bacterium]|nr:BatA and WFA domain-containing protein [Clostridia bacterium]